MVATHVRGALVRFGGQTLSTAASAAASDGASQKPVRQSGGEVFEELAAGDVADPLFQHARGQADALDQPAFDLTIAVLLSE